MTPAPIFTLDVGAGHVAAGRFGADGAGRLRLEAFAVERHDVAASYDDSWQTEVAGSIDRLRRRLRPVGHIGLSLAPHLVLARTVRAPAVAARRLNRMAVETAGKNIPYPLDDVIWDFHAGPETRPGLEMLLAAVKRGGMEQLCEAVARPECLITRALPAGIALREAFRINYPDVGECVLVADIGTRSTQLVFSVGDRFFLRTVGLGGGAIVAAVAGRLGIDRARAARLTDSVLARGVEPGPDAAAEAAIRRAASDIVGRVARDSRRALLSVQREWGIEKPTSVHLTGGGSLLAEAVDAFGDIFQVPAGRFDPIRRVELTDEARRDGASGSVHLFANLVGVAAAASRRTDVRPDLLPPSLLAARSAQRGWRRLGGASLLFALALIPPLLHFKQRAATLENATARMASVLGPLRALRLRIAESGRDLRRLERAIASLRVPVDRRFSWVSLLAGLQAGLAEVEDVWLDRLTAFWAPEAEENEGGPDRIGEAGAEPARSRMVPPRLRLGGRLLDFAHPRSRMSAESLDRVEQLLQALRGLPGVVATEEERFDSRRNGLLQFEVTLVLSPRCPL